MFFPRGATGRGARLERGARRVGGGGNARQVFFRRAALEPVPDFPAAAVAQLVRQPAPVCGADGFRSAARAACVLGMDAGFSLPPVSVRQVRWWRRRGTHGDLRPFRFLLLGAAVAAFRLAVAAVAAACNRARAGFPAHVARCAHAVTRDDYPRAACAARHPFDDALGDSAVVRAARAVHAVAAAEAAGSAAVAAGAPCGLWGGAADSCRQRGLCDQHRVARQVQLLLFAASAGGGGGGGVCRTLSRRDAALGRRYLGGKRVVCLLCAVASARPARRAGRHASAGQSASDVGARTRRDSLHRHVWHGR